MAYSKIILNDTALIDLTDDTVTAASMLSGIKATANDGVEVTGTIATKTSSNMTVSGKTVTAVAGYYATNQSKSVADGAYSASVSSHSISTTPVVTSSISGTVTNISTTTKPSGTDGTDYWTIAPSGSVTTTGVSSAKGKATIGTAGYLATGNKESSADTVNITPTVSNTTAQYLKKGAVTNNTSGGTSTATINRGSQIKIGTGYYPSDLYYTAQANSGTKSITASGTTSVDGYASASVSAGTITNNTSGGTSSGTINRGSQIKIGAGFYNSDAYYTAQANSGTKTISSSGTTSVDGYVNASVSAGSITNNTTLPSGSSSSGTINRGSYIKIGAGFYNSDAYYLAQNVSNGTITNNTSGGTSSGTVQRGKQIKIGAGYYASDAYYTAEANSGTLTVTSSGTTSCDGYANVSVSAGSITNNTSGGTSSGTINRGSQIKIGAGYYNSDTYYTAQSNTGTLTIDTTKNGGTISCNGYANVNVTGINIPKPSSGTNTFSVKVPNGTGTLTFVFNVDASGNVTITES